MNMSGSTVAPEQPHVYASLDSIHRVERGPANGDEYTLGAHANTWEEEDSKQFMCELCEQVFKTKKSFRLHCYKYHTRERLLQKSLMAIT